MKTLILYESFFGNTEEIAKIIFEIVNNEHQTYIKNVEEIDHSFLNDIDLLIAGSPTRAFNPTEKFVNFIKLLDSNALSGIKYAAFDTRIDKPDIDSKFLRIAVSFAGYAAKPISKLLKSKGGSEIIEPMGFFVKGEKGPLKEREKMKAEKWTREILSKI